MYSKFIAALLTLFVCLGVDSGQTVPSENAETQTPTAALTQSADDIDRKLIPTTAAALTEKYDFLSAEEAEALALAHAELHAGDVTVFRTEPDFEYGALVWDVEFRADDWEYEYTLHAETGEILKQERDYEPQKRTDTQPTSVEPSVTAPAESAVPAPTSPTQASVNEGIGADAAAEIALAHAGLKRDAVRGLRVERARDDGVPVYEIEFRDGAVEYEYEIHAQNGSVLDWDRDFDD